MNKHADISLHFYQGDHLHCSVGTTTSRTLLRNQNQPLAEQQHQAGNSSAKTLATDAQGSVLRAQAGMQTKSLSYTAYGHSPNEDGLDSLAGFNGEARVSQTGCYLLGNGYRAYNPVLRRFNSPDSLSPFGEGGLNAFAYCAGDPVNHTDPSGHMMRFNMNGKHAVYPGAHKLVPQSIKLRKPTPPPRTPSPPRSPVMPESSTRVSDKKRYLTVPEIALKNRWSTREDVEKFVSERKFKKLADKPESFHNDVTEGLLIKWQYPGASLFGFPKEVRDAIKSIRRVQTPKNHAGPY